MTEIQKLLFQHEDKGYKDFHGKLMPNINKDLIIGIRIPVLRTLAKDLFKNQPELVEKFLEELPHQFYEENNLHAFLLEQIKDFEKCVFFTEQFLPFVDNWATCDSFRPKCFEKNTEKVLELSKMWIKSEKTYTVRFGLGCLMNYFLDDDFKPEYFDLVCSVKSEEYYIKMMQAWYFATALAKQYDFAIKIIEENRLENWTHNKAIQKAIESYRVSEEHKKYLKTLKIF